MGLWDEVLARLHYRGLDIGDNPEALAAALPDEMRGGLSMAKLVQQARQFLHPTPPPVPEPVGPMSDVAPLDVGGASAGGVGAVAGPGGIVGPSGSHMGAGMGFLGLGLGGVPGLAATIAGRGTSLAGENLSVIGPTGVPSPVASENSPPTALAAALTNIGKVLGFSVPASSFLSSNVPGLTVSELAQSPETALMDMPFSLVQSVIGQGIPGVVNPVLDVPAPKVAGEGEGVSGASPTAGSGGPAGAGAGPGVAGGDTGGPGGEAPYRGGYLKGKRTKERTVPKAHGGEYVVNATAARQFGPLLEALNAAVPPDPNLDRLIDQGKKFFDV